MINTNLKFKSNVNNHQQIAKSFMEANNVMAEILENLKEDIDQNLKGLNIIFILGDERSEKLTGAFIIIDNELERMKNQINSFLDENQKKDFNESNEKLEISYNIQNKRDQILTNTESNYVSTDEIILTRENILMISETNKKELDTVKKDIIQQEKNLQLVKDNLNKIFN